VLTPDDVTGLVSFSGLSSSSSLVIEISNSSSLLHAPRDLQKIPETHGGTVHKHKTIYTCVYYLADTIGAFACSRPKSLEKFRSRAREHTVAVRKRS